MGSDPRLAGLSEPLRLQAKQHPGGLREEAEQAGEVDVEPDGDSGGSCRRLEAPAERFHSGVGLGVVDGQVGLHLCGDSF